MFNQCLCFLGASHIYQPAVTTKVFSGLCKLSCGQNCPLVRTMYLCIDLIFFLSLLLRLRTVPAVINICSVNELINRCWIIICIMNEFLSNLYSFAICSIKFWAKGRDKHLWQSAWKRTWKVDIYLKFLSNLHSAWTSCQRISSLKVSCVFSLCPH